MSSKISQWETRLLQVTTAAKNEFGHLTANQLNWKPAPGVWSLGQVIHHLIVINKTYFPVIDQLKAGTYKKPFMGRFKFMVNFFGNFILRSVEPERRKKIKTFPIWEPAQSHIPGDILQQFEQHQNELIALIKSCEHLLYKGIVISSPANKTIVYTLEQAFEIIVTHEQRHLIQAMEIAAMLKQNNVLH